MALLSNSHGDLVYLKCKQEKLIEIPVKSNIYYSDSEKITTIHDINRKCETNYIEKGLHSLFAGNKCYILMYDTKIICILNYSNREMFYKPTPEEREMRVCEFNYVAEKQTGNSLVDFNGIDMIFFDSRIRSVVELSINYPGRINVCKLPDYTMVLNVKSRNQYNGFNVLYIDPFGYIREYNGNKIRKNPNGYKLRLRKNMLTVCYESRISFIVKNGNVYNIHAFDFKKKTYNEMPDFDMVGDYVFTDGKQYYILINENIEEIPDSYLPYGLPPIKKECDSNEEEELEEINL